MNRWVSATGACLALLGLITAFQNCGQGFKAALFDAESESSVKSFSLAPTYYELKEKIFDVHCASCHTAGGAGQSALDLTSYATLMANAVAVQPPSPTDSELYLRAADHTMPPTGPLAPSEIQAIANWIIAYAPQGVPPTPPANPKTAPAAPANLRMLAQGTGQVDLAWDDLATNEDGFVVERSDGGGEFAAVLSTLSSVTSVRDLGLKDGVSYVYRVVARNAYGASDYSNALTVVTALPTPDNPPPNVTAPSATAGAAPTNLRLLAVTGTTATLGWTDRSSDETQFQLELSDDGVTFRDQNAFSRSHPTEPNAVSASLVILSPLTKYYARVRADFAGGVGAPSEAITFTTLAGSVSGPQIPMTLVVDSVSPNQVTLRRTGVGASFTVTRATSVNGPFTEVQLRQQTAAPGLYFSAAQPDTQYYYRINGADPGVTTVVKTPALRATPPRAPTGLVAKATDISVVSLYWTDNSDDEYTFEFQRSTDGVNFGTYSMSGAAEEGWADRNLNAATTYYYRVRAVNLAGGSAFSNVAQATTWAASPALSTPRDLSVVTVTDRTITLGYRIPNSPVSSLYLETSTDGVAFTQNGVFATVGDASFTGLSANTTYYLRLRTSSAGVYSNYSAVISATTAAARPAVPPPAPTNLVAQAAPGGAVYWTWQYASPFADYFVVETSGNGVSGFTAVAAYTDGRTTADAHTTSYAAGRGTAITPLYARVYAKNQYGSSGYSNVAGVTGGYAPDGKPDRSFISLTRAGPTSAAVTIGTYATNMTGFALETSIDGISYRRAATLAANATSYTLSGLTAGTKYWVRARAFNAYGAGDGYVATIQTDEVPGLSPRAPDGLYVPDVRATQLQLTWNDNSSTETGFQVERSSDGLTWTTSGSVGPNVTQFKVTGLTPWTLYLFRVRATNANGASVSEQLSWTTNASPAPLP